MKSIFMLSALALAVLVASSVDGRSIGYYGNRGGQGYVGRGRNYYRYEPDYSGQDYYDNQRYYGDQDYLGDQGYYGSPIRYRYGDQGSGYYGQGYDGGRRYYGNQGNYGDQGYYGGQGYYGNPSHYRPSYNSYNSRPIYSDSPAYYNRPSYGGAPAHQSLASTEDGQDVVINLKGFKENIGDATYDPNGIDRTLQNTRRGQTNFDIDDKRRNQQLNQVQDNDYYDGSNFRGSKSDVGSRLRQQGKVAYDLNDLDAITNEGRDRQKESRGHQASDVARDDQRYADKDYLRKSDGVDGDYYDSKANRDASRNRDRSRKVQDFVKVDNSLNSGQDTDKYFKKNSASQYQGDKQAATDNEDDNSSDGDGGHTDSRKSDNRRSQNIDDNRETADDINEDSQRNFGQDIHKLESSKHAQQNQGQDAAYSRQQGASNSDLVGEEPSSSRYDHLDSSSKVIDKKAAKNSLNTDDSQDYGETQVKKSSGDNANSDAGNTKTYKFVVDNSKGPIDTNALITAAMGMVKLPEQKA